ncbi:MAG: low molecular weight phosphotyrosine protein phosphatase [Burkholderiales bacterium]|nr:low molecular weight phosphotyrosine protein phosphatase [Burkholderiales bacterium]
MKQILTLCAGNICRSPIAAALLEREFPGKTVMSAGLGALEGSPADPLAVEVAAAHGLDLSRHRARQLASWMCKSAELILVMEQGHKAELARQYPLVRGKVFRLGDVGNFDIADPYRRPKAAFEVAYSDIARGVADWLPRLQEF